MLLDGPRRRSPRPRIRRGLLVIDSTDWHGGVHPPARWTTSSPVYHGLVMGVTDYVQKCGFSPVVLGLSGGIDSSLIAAVAVEALGPDTVHGVAMPSHSTPRRR